MRYQYFDIVLCFLLISLIFIILYSIVFLLGIYKPQFEKLSAYECGFHPFQDTRQKFNIRYYLVCILFLIFDLEICYLFPWIVSIRELGILGFWVIYIFIIILTIGLIYEWLKGALNWE